ncbi:hypothetical protein [Actinomadura fibrosa]|uniref:LapA family protein n=1 Tax=Actinomadura fibrosa TaxID=111802 RepID=A0ABW2XFL7_9ACTN|nr:hypothetical protein [Actinomadura fibrosa]
MRVSVRIADEDQEIASEAATTRLPLSYVLILGVIVGLAIGIMLAAKLAARPRHAGGRHEAAVSDHGLLRRSRTRR